MSDWMRVEAAPGRFAWWPKNEPIGEGEVASDLVDFDRALRASAVGRSALQDRALSAYRDPGAAVLARVWCVPCVRSARDPGAVGELRETSFGRLFVAVLPGGVGVDIEERGLTIRQAREAKVRLPYFEQAVVAVLVDEPSEGQDWPCRVRCARHGSASLSEVHVGRLRRGRDVEITPTHSA